MTYNELLSIIEPEKEYTMKYFAKALSALTDVSFPHKALYYHIKKGNLPSKKVSPFGDKEIVAIKGSDFISFLRCYVKGTV